MSIVYSRSFTGRTPRNGNCVKTLKQLKDFEALGAPNVAQEPG
jgi:hypothetical protein